MATIGTFTHDGEHFTGTIATLALKAKTTIQANAKRSDKAPDFRIFAGGIEIGAAWSRISKAERPYLSVKLDDPSFGAAIFCRLIAMEDGGHRLFWNR